MSDTKLLNDASSSIKGTLYQFYIAVDKCFDMKEGQKVIVERLGDVTLSESQQLEVKHYTDPLTDNHLNFWGTLRNWMLEEFDETAYCSLILCTTQKISDGSLLKEWNSLTCVKRMNILKTIHDASEVRYEQQTKGTQNKNVPESLKLQRWVRDPGRSSKLASVVERLVITHNHPDMSAVFAEIKQKHAKGILRAKQDDFLDALVGFIISPENVVAHSWEITYDAFVIKVRELTSKYCKDTKQFPMKYKKQQCSKEHHSHRTFVKKIMEIEYGEAVAQAIADYVFATQTVLHELRAYEVPVDCYEAFAENVLAQFTPLYRKACRTVSNSLRDSQNFYDEMMALNPPAFPGFEMPPHDFKNGVIHIHADDASSPIKWKLESK